LLESSILAVLDNTVRFDNPKVSITIYSDIFGITKADISTLADSCLTKSQ